MMVESPARAIEVQVTALLTDEFDSLKHLLGCVELAPRRGDLERGCVVYTFGVPDAPEGAVRMEPIWFWNKHGQTDLFGITWFGADDQWLKTEWC